MQPLELVPQELTNFFNSWAIFSKFSPLERRLENFFPQLKDCLPLKNKELDRKPHLSTSINLIALDNFLKALQQPIFIAKRAGFFCNPWSVASLKRKEVPNSSVLAWWMNPHGTHGFGNTFLMNLLHSIKRELPLGFPQVISPLCRVSVETHPDGNTENRVDIEINDPRFFLIVEVKIDAPEGRNQLLRYCKIAEKRSNGRPWAILYLTPQNRHPIGTADDPKNDSTCMTHIIPISWKKISSLLNISIKNHNGIFENKQFPELALMNLLARSFVTHINQF